MKETVAQPESEELQSSDTHDPEKEVDGESPSEPRDDGGQDEEEYDEKDDAEQLPEDGESHGTEHEEEIKSEYDEETKKIIEGGLFVSMCQESILLLVLTKMYLQRLTV